MKKIFSVLSILALFAVCTVDSYAANNGSDGSTSGGDFRKVGAAGGQFLKIGVGSRAAAMGGAYSAESGDLTSIYWNAAGLASVKSMQADFSYTQWISGYKHNFVAMAMPLGDNFVVAGHMISLNSDDIEITTIDRPDGTGVTYQISDVAFGLSLAGYLTDQFSFGVTARYLSSSFTAVSSNGFSFDIGTLYDTGIHGIKLGFSIHNLGTEQNYSGQDLKTSRKLYDALFASPLTAEYLSSNFNIPIAFHAGISADVWQEDVHKVRAAADFTTFSDVPEQFSLGAEYGYNDLLFARAGYKFGKDQFGLSGGIGIKYFTGSFGGKFDYSASNTTDFGVINRISLSLQLGE